MMKLKKNAMGGMMRSSIKSGTKSEIKSDIKSGSLSTVMPKPLLVKISKNKLSNDFLSENCACCYGEIRSSKRDFSDQAWAALVDWQEISSSVVDQSICDDCYLNLRDTLIERANELKARSVGGQVQATLHHTFEAKNQTAHRTDYKKSSKSDSVTLRVIV